MSGSLLASTFARPQPESASLEKLIAKWLGLPPSDVKVAVGGKSRLKQVAIDGDGTALSALIGQRLAEL